MSDLSCLRAGKWGILFVLAPECITNFRLGVCFLFVQLLLASLEETIGW
jgi:hypothetical protein